MTPAADSTLIRVAHSPDADDAFMFYALAHDKVDTEGLRFEHTLTDIETLNREAEAGTYELTALSYHAYAYVHTQYVLLDVGASIGDKYGPVLIAREPLSKADLAGKPIAVPGERTTAYLALKLWDPSLVTRTMPFDQIQDAVASGEVAAGLIIHEGQLTYPSLGLKKIVDLGEWWFDAVNLPLPLGANAIRRDLGEDVILKTGRALKRSIQYALDHREEALDYALSFARGLRREDADQFVGMYVNDMTLHTGAEIRRAARLLLYMGFGAGVLPAKIDPEFVAIENTASCGPCACA
ncbi:MAG: ABC transporter substrate-binding protein [Vampirovibrionales bacterium]|nr:ABC transporter substrate-binding protein [Vampirovibrionales bacterium]